MARGWESKSVESQIESLESKRAAARTKPLSPAEMQVATQRESLELSRKRVLHDLGQASNPRYRQTLEAALKHLEEQLAKIK